MILGLITGLVWFALYLVGHVVVWRAVSKVARPRVNQAIFLIGLIGIPLTLLSLVSSLPDTVLTQGDPIAAAFCGMLVYASLLVLYTPFYYVIAASLSVRTAVLLGREPGGVLPLAVLQDEFVSRKLIAQRLDTMAENGFLIASPRGYQLTAKGCSIAAIFDTLKALWKLGPGG